mmetsp:Transcript_27361/g.78718  ORF Transcript_27361/g.78718 Transcript_27361/m.78718 type:complete len:88 (+) Transcript_27361:741-1004(+)
MQHQVKTAIASHGYVCIKRAGVSGVWVPLNRRRDRQDTTGEGGRAEALCLCCSARRGHEGGREGAIVLYLLCIMCYKWCRRGMHVMI